ncbi:MAG TPA: hypothetical protein VEA69_15175 [Tepidisphaeraceae bacterium]|nr:hypothetical protein [Tepidisphaeraceae bacterium]
MTVYDLVAMAILCAAPTALFFILFVRLQKRPPRCGFEVLPPGTVGTGARG